ncbi:2-nitropropane dioxygenase NppD [Cupriavidus necator]|uniref:2-nitropropane dioxygenase NppD n=1 Tax=Cupriavidus necator TaxID=106590 RepID=A0A1K0JNV6_CUPNE|nr:2-nitropropane dioxygenase NppD [Cupriavidus necator]
MDSTTLEPSATAAANARQRQPWQRARLPLIAAPMLRVSGPEWIVAACRAGVIGSFPTVNARTTEELDQWMGQIRAALDQDPRGARACAPFCPNLIMSQPRYRDRLHHDLDCLVRHRVEMVITSVGSPAPVLGPLHDIGCKVFADVASVEHAGKAIRAGADGLVLLTAGAGGQTGWANGMAFVRAVRAFYDGPVVLAGGIADGHAMWAAQVLGCDLVSMGTKFIATEESMADAAHKSMIVGSSMDDVLRTRAFTGLDANMLRPSIEAAGLNPAELDETVSREAASARFGGGPKKRVGPQRWADIFSAGHSVSGVRGVGKVADVVEQTLREYQDAKSLTRKLLG